MVLDNKERLHLDAIANLISQSDEMIVASPFLSTDIRALLDAVGTGWNIKEVTLVTVLDAFDEGLRKAPILQNFIDYCGENNVKYKILINETLHSKIYLFKKSGNIHSAIVTSANFTRKGLKTNHETGIVVTDTESIQFLAKNMVRSCKNLSGADVATINEAAQAHKAKHGGGKKKPKPFRPWQFVAKPEMAPTLYPNRKIYIKPVGCAEEPYLDHKPIGSQLDFEKRRPGVKIGDILICYAVGPRDILGYYEVETEPVEEPDGGRWPWSVQGKCLSPKYSQQYWKYGLKIGNMVHQYNTEYPNEPVSATGNTRLGALNWGKDKIVLDNRFADYLISRIELAQTAL